MVKTYKYLGIFFSSNGNFTVAIKHLVEQAQKAMFSILKRARVLKLPIDIQLQLFHTNVLPVALYGCEVWGFDKNGIKLVERLHLRFCKYVLRLKKLNAIIHGIW